VNGLRNDGTYLIETDLERQERLWTRRHERLIAAVILAIGFGFLVFWAIHGLAVLVQLWVRGIVG